ncbi:MAG: homoserine dehydrogenase [Gemmatimonadaceae bacterium]
MTPQQLEVAEPSERDFLLTAAPHLNRSTRAEPFLRIDPPDLQQPRTIRLALAGCGVVGGGLVRLLQESAAATAARFGVRFVFARVLVRDPARDRRLPIDSRLFTNDLDSFLAQDADIVVEALGGDEPARTIAIRSLQRGRKVVTANKDLIATHGESLHALAHKNFTVIDFGAAVGGSAPVISTLRDLLGAGAPRSIRGILNGTANFVISGIERGQRLDEALAAAREGGLAEADCARDLDGRDAAAKLDILAWIAFGIQPSTLDVRRISLLPGLEDLVRFAHERGARVRQIAECSQLEGNSVSASVEPVIVPDATPFGRTVFEENRVEVDLGWTSPLSVSGPGAGGAPTAAALLSDLLRASNPTSTGGRGSPKFFSVADYREHRWLVCGRLDSRTVSLFADKLGIPIRLEFAASETAYVVTDRITWARARQLLDVLEKLGVAPSVARYELTDFDEVTE